MLLFFIYLIFATLVATSYPQVSYDPLYLCFLGRITLAQHFPLIIILHFSLNLTFLFLKAYNTLRLALLTCLCRYTRARSSLLSVCISKSRNICFVMPIIDISFFPTHAIWFCYQYNERFLSSVI